MALYAVVGGHGAPGATVTALAMLHAWPLQSGQRVLLAECDPDGGVILSGALEGRLDGSRGLGQLGVADRRGQLAQALMTQLTDVSPGGTADRLLLPGVSDPAQYSGLAYVWESLATLLLALEGQGVDVLVDLGRSGASGPGAVLAHRADAVLMVVRSTLRSLTTAHPRLAALRADLDAHGGGSDTLGLVMVEEGPYKASDVSAQLGTPVVGLLPFAPATALVLSDGGNSHDRRFVRSPLLRASRTVIDEVRTQVARRRVRLTPPQSAPQPERQPAPQPERQGEQQPGPIPGPTAGPAPAPAPAPTPDQAHPYARPGARPDGGSGHGPGSRPQPVRHPVPGFGPGPMSGPFPGPVPPSPPAPMPMPTAPAPSGPTPGATIPTAPIPTAHAPAAHAPAPGPNGELHVQVVGHAR
ncbi:hypothetical protein [Streptacidiphilus sp. PB12-B1b]|uniref:hypothetical protein n=1 Tax=Streptacidiphilus sp. PB12-B1b TaxID=2705012 RepID=UPI0015FCD62C|nr:hypothetical protein [Streptacidiphilus sp. PB12-B1b]